MSGELWHTVVGDGPIFAAAVHHGYEVRDEVAALLALDDLSRLREEDPYTGEWTVVAPNRLVPRRSRFEVDLNRPRETAVYRTPEDAWGLAVWHGEPSQGLVDRSLEIYDAFYAEAHRMLSELERRYGFFVVFDLHSYNHRRLGPDGPPDPPHENPEVNIGTGTMDRARWAPVVDRFIADLREFDFCGRRLDVRENVKFKGRNFPGWVHRTFPRSGCALAIEFKKFFMDEWTGEIDPEPFAAIPRALGSTVPGILEELERLGVDEK